MTLFRLFRSSFGFPLFQGAGSELELLFGRRVQGMRKNHWESVGNVCTILCRLSRNEDTCDPSLLSFPPLGSFLSFSRSSRLESQSPFFPFKSFHYFSPKISKKRWTPFASLFSETPVLARGALLSLLRMSESQVMTIINSGTIILLIIRIVIFRVMNHQ